MKISPHFTIEEFVPEQIFRAYGDSSIWFVDMRLIEGMEWLRTFFAVPITINNWHTGGSFQNRGFRHPMDSKYARLSQHKFGRACDFNVYGLTAPQVYDIILANKATIMENTAFTTIEDVADTPTWTHIDLRLTKSDQLLIVKP